MSEHDPLTPPPGDFRHPLVPPPAWFVIAGIAMVLADRWFPVTHWLADPWRALLGYPVMAAGSVLGLWAAGLFKVRGTPVLPFRRSTSLVVSGVYRITRNPMYLGLACVLFGLALRLGSVSPLAVLPLFMAVIEVQYIRREEHFLTSIFGDDYREYRRRVRRWL
jgi:protein-S-isoprenylcysteine O-methyltransferase Ste14